MTDPRAKFLTAEQKQQIADGMRGTLQEIRAQIDSAPDEETRDKYQTQYDALLLVARRYELPL